MSRIFAHPLLVLFGLIATMGVSGSAIAQRKGFIPKAEPKKEFSRSRGASVRKGPQYKRAERSDSQLRAMAREKRQKQYQLLQQMIKTTPRNDPEDPNSFIGWRACFGNRPSKRKMQR